LTIGQITLSSVSCTGTAGQFSCSSASVTLNSAIRTSAGPLTGTATGIAANTTYYVVAGGTATTTFQLSATPGGTPITTTAGSVTGLTFTRVIVSATFASTTPNPFLGTSKVTIAGVTMPGFTNGTYLSTGVTGTTGVSFGAYATGTATVQGTVAVINATNVGSAYRIRAFPNATNMYSTTRVVLVDHQVTAQIVKADTITLQQGTASTNHLVLDSAKATFTNPVVLPSYTSAALRGITGAAGWMASVSDSATTANRIAYWSTTATAGWRYMKDDSAV
jgi:hypothetical protein